MRQRDATTARPEVSLPPPRAVSWLLAVVVTVPLLLIVASLHLPVGARIAIYVLVLGVGGFAAIRVDLWTQTRGPVEPVAPATTPPPIAQLATSHLPAAWWSDPPAPARLDAMQATVLAELRTFLARERFPYLTPAGTSSEFGTVLGEDNALTLFLDHAARVESGPDHGMRVVVFLPPGRCAVHWSLGHIERTHWDDDLQMALEALLAGRNRTTVHRRRRVRLAVDCELWPEDGEPLVLPRRIEPGWRVAVLRRIPLLMFETEFRISFVEPDAVAQAGPGRLS